LHVISSRPEADEKSLLGDNYQGGGWPEFKPGFGFAIDLTIKPTASGISRPLASK
jgi:hypothetical protein